MTRSNRGRPARLTPQTAAQILKTVEAGNHITTACAAAGVHRATLYRWLERGLEAERALERGEHVEASELVFRDFRDTLAVARAHAEMHAVEVIQGAIRGGFVTREAVATDRHGVPVRDRDGAAVMNRCYGAPDGRLALAFLARASPEHWGPSARPSLSAEEAGAVEPRENSMASEARLLDLRRRLHALAGSREERAS